MPSSSVYGDGTGRNRTVSGASQARRTSSASPPCHDRSVPTPSDLGSYDGSLLVSTSGSPGSRAPTQQSLRPPPPTGRPARSVASIVKPAFSAPRRDAQLPTRAYHSIRVAPTSEKPHRQSADRASVVTPRPRPPGAAQ